MLHRLSLRTVSIPVVNGTLLSHICRMIASNLPCLWRFQRACLGLGLAQAQLLETTSGMYRVSVVNVSQDSSSNNNVCYQLMK